MFKLVVLSALLAVAAARPGLYHEASPLVYSAPSIVQEHSLAKVGAIVKSIPTAVSHQSSTVVHNSAHVVQPIVAPVVKTYAAAPIHSAPLVHSSYASLAAPAHISYAAASPLAIHSAPISLHSAPSAYAYGHGW
ncbi:cuticle protein LPCP-23-like [Eupeodes corollae]|uniref:cuticle protein LPCP-23-like n=1 Tax=Eupeodes corollae TaxID=290404 RepID=UPI002490A14A|nr:cuticle protein LPCP-23-like [Eupeodes corollae]